MTHSSDGKPIAEKQTGLQPNAYLDAERLFRQTGDLRYLVIALGKPTGSHGIAEIPGWILEACDEYADAIADTPLQLRKKIKHSFMLEPLDDAHGGYRYPIFKRALDRLAKRDQDVFHSNNKLKPFQTVVGEEHLAATGEKATPSDLQHYNRWRNETRIAGLEQVSETECVETEGSWLSEEQAIQRSGLRRANVTYKK